MVESVPELLNDSANSGFDGGHPLIQTLLAAEARNRIVDPTGNIGLHHVPNAQVPVFNRAASWPSAHRHKFKWSGSVDERPLSVAHTVIVADELLRRCLCIDGSDPPLDEVVPTVAIQLRQFVEPPEGMSSGFCGDVVRLSVLDPCPSPVREITEPLFCQLRELCRIVAYRKLQRTCVRRRIRTGVVHGQFVHQRLKSGAQIIQPFSEDDR